MDDTFDLDTKNFDTVITHARTLANLMRDLKDNMDAEAQIMISGWSGLGRNTFEKKYRLYSKQLGDLKDDLFEIAESLLEMEEQYIQADTDAAKALDGVSNRY